MHFSSCLSQDGKTVGLWNRIQDNAVNKALSALTIESLFHSHIIGMYC